MYVSHEFPFNQLTPSSNPTYECNKEVNLIFGYNREMRNQLGNGMYNLTEYWAEQSSPSFDNKSSYPYR